MRHLAQPMLDEPFVCRQQRCPLQLILFDPLHFESNTVCWRRWLVPAYIPARLFPTSDLAERAPGASE